MAFLQAVDPCDEAGDRYGDGWVEEAFRKAGVRYLPSELPKSALYANLLPLINSGQLELLDDPRLVSQLLGLLLNQGATRTPYVAPRARAARSAPEGP